LRGMAFVALEIAEQRRLIEVLARIRKTGHFFR
jgi:hypothetical protein